MPERDEPAQLTLLELDDPADAVTKPTPDRSFSALRRIDLDDTSWLEFVPGWLSGGATLFAELLDSAGWEHRDRWMFDKRVQEPRLTAEFPVIAAAPPALQDIGAALGDHYGVAYPSAWINLYRHHRDSTSWHGDHVGKTQAVSSVPVLSLGATRRFLIRPRDGGSSTSLTVGSGDLVVMRGRAQRDFRHSVPKQAREAGPRISINFAPAA